MSMKPYGRTTDNYGDTGCCPGHDEPYIRKWSGSYSSNGSRRLRRKAAKIQNRTRRRKDKQMPIDNDYFYDDGPQYIEDELEEGFSFTDDPGFADFDDDEEEEDWDSLDDMYDPELEEYEENWVAEEGYDDDDDFVW